MRTRALRNAWLALLGLTLATLIINAALAGMLAPGIRTVLSLGLAGIKAWVILAAFVGIDRTARGWRTLLAVYLIVLCGLLAAVYTGSCVHHGVQCFSGPREPKP